MFDIHSHILPCIDDGSKNVRDSVEMLKALYELGITEIILTPHFYPHIQPLEDFVRMRDASLAALLREIKDTGAQVPKLHLGAEVYLDNLLFNNYDLTPLTFDSRGDYMLLELQYLDTFTSTTMAMVERVAYNVGIIPVLAHIERYPFLHSERTLKKLLEAGCLAQANITSFSDFDYKRKLAKYVKKGYITALGSDIHAKTQLPALKTSIPLISDSDKAAIEASTRKLFNIAHGNNILTI